MALAARSQSLVGSRGQKQNLRQQAAEIAQQLIEGTEGEVAALQQAQARGRSDLLAQAARGLAAGTTPSLVGTGAGAAQARQAALSTGQALAGLEAQQAGQVSRARHTAAQAALEGLSFQQEMGTEADARKAKQQALEQQIQVIKEKNTGTFTDSGEQAAQEIRSLAQYEDDPEIRRWLDERARQTEGELEDVSFLGLDF